MLRRQGAGVKERAAFVGETPKPVLFVAFGREQDDDDAGDSEMVTGDMRR